MISNMDMEVKLLQMAANIMAIFHMERSKERENMFGKMEINILENGKII